METKNQDSLKSQAKTPSLRYQRDKDRELVKGVFNFYETKGGKLKFAYKKYKGDPIETYELEDGKVYSLPRGVAKHLNTSGSYRQHEYITDEQGKPTQKLGKDVRRYGFQSLEFTTFDEMESGGKIITVENV